MAKDLELKALLPISDANVGLIALIAKKHGWSEDTQYLSGVLDDDGNEVSAPMTATDFVCYFRLKKHLEDYFNSEVSETFDWAFGVLQAEAKAGVMSALNTELQVTAEIKDRTDG